MNMYMYAYKHMYLYTHVYIYMYMCICARLHEHVFFMMDGVKGFQERTGTPRHVAFVNIYAAHRNTSL